MRFLSAIILTAAALSASPLPARAARFGVAARYSSEYKMRRAAALHRVSVPAGLEVCASPLQPLGTRLLVRSSRLGTAWECIVGDVAHPRHRARILARDIIVELTPRGAMRLCGSVLDPPRQCPVVVEVQP